MTATIDQLKLIFQSQLSDESLQFFLDSAVELVDGQLASSGLTSTTKDRIAVFLAGHFAHTAAPRVESEKVGDYSYSSQGQTGMNLQATFYGQNALALDTSGTLGRLGKKVARFEVITGSQE